MESETGKSVMVEYRQLDSNALAEISGFAGDAKKLLRLWMTRNPRRIVTAIDRWIVEFRASGESYEENRLGGAAIRFGCLWGDAVVKEYGWQWIEACHDGDFDDTYFVVVSPNRGYVIYPVVRAYHWLTDRDREPFALFLFDTLPSMPEAGENEYVNVE